VYDRGKAPIVFFCTIFFITCINFKNNSYNLLTLKKLRQCKKGSGRKMGKLNKIAFYTNVLTKLQIISEQEKETILKKMTKKG